MGISFQSCDLSMGVTSCADPESFVRGGPNSDVFLLLFFVCFF